MSLQRVAIVALAMGIGVSISTAQSNGRSPLWGHAGELWDPTGRLPDFSHAGYRGGSAALPEVPVVANVRDFGARGNGVTDDVRAFRAAIAAVAQTGAPGAVLVPAGTYAIGDILEIDVDGVVLRGEGSGPQGSVLYFPTPGSAITGASKPWIHGQGGLLHFGDRSSGNPGEGAVLADVTRDQQRGDRVLELDSTASIQAGDYVILELIDDKRGTLGLHIHNDQASGGTCSYQPLPTQWVVPVESVQGRQLTLAEPLRLDVRSEWSPRVRAYRPVSEVGLEHVHLACAPHVYPGHLLELGYNPVTFDGVLNGWIDDVTVEYADNGPSLVGLTKHCTFQNVVLLAGTDAHHGFSLVYADDCLIQDFVIEPVFRHGVTLDHQAAGNVVRRGAGTDLYLDHHRDGSFENLFTDLDMGYGQRPWYSGGSSCAGPRAGARNTYWNLRSPSWAAPPGMPTSPEWAQIQSNLLPARIDLRTPDNEWYEVHAALQAPDLYTAQLERRIDTELLQGAPHTVVTFEDGTTHPLGQEEGAAPTIAGGTLWAGAAGLARWVDGTRRRGDQEILLELAPGFPQGARAGALIRAATTSESVNRATQVFVERLNTQPGQPSYVLAQLFAPGGTEVFGPPIPVDPDRTALELRILVDGDRLTATVQGLPALAAQGIPDPAGGGYTSLFLAAGAAWQGLGVRHAHVFGPGPAPGVDLTVDGDGTLWMTFVEDGIGFVPDMSKFAFWLNQTPLSFSAFSQRALPHALGIESRGPSHLTIGFPTSKLRPGDHLRLDYGVRDETFVPWWR